MCVSDGILQLKVFLIYQQGSADAERALAVAKLV